MTATRNLGMPTSSLDYGTFAWHRKWSVDLQNRLATHASGLVFRFTSNAVSEGVLPIGGITPNGAWHGKLEGGAASIPKRMPAHVAIRICREALQIFADMAIFSCQDCMIDTVETRNYYMVHNEVWQQANPKNHGMLCLPCLQRRLNRRLTLDDFTGAPINSLRVDLSQFSGTI